MPSQERRKRPARGAPENPQQQRAAGNKAKRAGAQAPRLAADPRFQRRAEAFYALGPQVLALLLSRLAAEHDCGRQISSYLDAAVENAPAVRAYLDRWPGAAP